MKVKLSVVIDAIEMADDAYTYFLDIENGESVMLADELITGIDNEGLGEEIDNNPDRFFRLPTKFDINEYHIMEEFIWSLDDERQANKLENVIHGKGAFHRFKDMLYKLGIEQQWYAYQADAYKKIAKKWCRDNQIEYIE